jgi:DNA-directed RNA polymerase alpha subunit
MLPRAPFHNRRFSRRTIDALIARGIDAPERLLFATEADLKRIPGVGRASLNEIMRYRAQFLPEPDR